MWAIFRRRWRTLLAAALVIFIPVGLLEVIDDELQGAFNELDAFGALELIELLAAAFVHAAGSLLGEVLYTGIVAATVRGEREGHTETLRELLRRLPVGRLMLVDLLLGLIVVIGILLLVVPGIVFIVWFALVAPAVEIEDRRVLESFRRSRNLVRGHFWLVLALIVPVLVVGDALSVLATSGSLFLLGDSFAGEWVAAALAETLTAPLFALAAVVLFYELREARPG